ncbi:MAG: GNAT family N-acetyltransferase [Kordiimonadaceae bacterium]|nr:GNAT family N-acetyltransferase [Kordiimonadaceae bacterium]
MNLISIRNGAANEIEFLRDLQLRSGVIFEAIGMQKIAESPPTERLVFTEAIQHNWLHVACLSGEVAGFTIGQQYGETIHLEQMSVAPEHARRGIGGQLLRAFITEAMESGFENVTLSTFMNVPWNAPFYAKAGFEPVSETEMSPFLRRLQKAEHEVGLDMTARVCMQRKL